MAHHEHHAHDHHEMGHRGRPNGATKAKLQAGHEHVGHESHAGHSEATFARLFWVSLVLTIPVLVYSELLQHVLGYSAPAFPGSAWLSPALSSVIYWYCGWVFLRGAVSEISQGRPGMMTLVGLAITTAYFYSLAVTFGLLRGTPFYFELATLVTIMLLGHWMEMRAIGRAQSALEELAKLLPDTAERLVDDHTEEVPVADLQVGDLILVRPGARVPADGQIERGHSSLDESMITGESRPVDKGEGNEVVAGTVNIGGGALHVRVTRVGEDTVLSGIMRLVREAQASRGRAQVLADRAAYWLTLIAVAVAIATFAIWLSVRGLDNYTIERVVSTLVIACPHALGLAIPLVVAISTTMAARSGILVWDRAALERARKVDVVVFDKTGTLTLGQQGLVDMAVVDGFNPETALSLAASAEQQSEHTIARALVTAAKDRGLSLSRVDDFSALSGRGISAKVGTHQVQVGGPRLIERDGLGLPEALADRSSEWSKRGQTVVYLVVDDRPVAAFSLADVIRPESYEAVRTLKEMGIKVSMLTGDSKDVARWVASELGIDEYFAEVLPEHKHEKIRQLQAKGLIIAMVGDGVNDAPALAQADVGIAIGAGTDVARASAAIVLVRDDPRDVAKVIALSRASYRKMVQNLAWAAGYNLLALPLAAGVLAPVGVVLPPAVGALLMSLSTIAVALNAQLLRRQVPST